MPSLSFYWRGSTAANISSLSWDTLANWRLLTYSATAGFVAYPATRLPMGNDAVYFGHPYNLGITGQRSLTTLSPCLFGGVTTASTSWWSGATAGSSVAEKHGGISVQVLPNYPFSKLGGKIDEQILEEWSQNLRVQSGIVSAGGAFSATGPNQWTLASGTEYVDAAYVSQWYGVTVGISYGNQPAYAIRHRGYWADNSKYGTFTSIFGVTGNTAGAGGSGPSYDGSFNRVNIGNAFIHAFGSNGNIGSLPGESGLGAFGYSYGTETPTNDTYRHGSIEVSGFYNSIEQSVSTRDAQIILTNAKVNSVNLYANAVVPFFTGALGGIASSRITGLTQTWFDFGGLYMDKDSTARFVSIEKMETMASPVVIHGDITPSGGFACVYPSGISSGISSGVLLPNGSMRFTPPIYSSGEASEVILGYPSSEGTKQTTAITHFYAEVPYATYSGFTYSLAGNYTGTNFWLKSGTVAFDSVLPSRASLEISNLALQGDSVFDATSGSFQGTANITVVPTSDSVVIKPGSGNQFSMARLFSLNG